MDKLLALAKLMEDNFASQTDALAAKGIQAASDDLGAALTPEEVATSATADRKLLFAALNKGIGLIGKK